MPRDSSGSYVLPAGNPVSPNTIIESLWANTTMDDIAAALTDSLSRTGQGGMLVAFRNADGSISAPGITWSNEPTMGWYRFGPGGMRVTINAQDIAGCTVDGLAVYKDLQVDGAAGFADVAITGGTLAGVTVTGSNINTCTVTGGTMAGAAIDNTIIGQTARQAAFFTNATADGVIYASDGTAAAPAIANKTNTGTGIYFPGVNVWALANNGAETVRGDPAGNIGIGVIPSAWETASGSQAIQLPGGALYGYRDTALYLAQNLYYDGSWKYYASSIAAMRLEMASGDFVLYSAPSGTADNAATASIRAIIRNGGQIASEVSVSHTSSGFPDLKTTNTASTGTMIGHWLLWSGQSPNNGASTMAQWQDSTAYRAYITSNGGLSNYQANDANLSDGNLKRNISYLADTPELQDAAWAFTKRMLNAWATYEYDDQTHGDKNTGYVAQAVQAAAGKDFPELVDYGKIGQREGAPESMVVYDHDLHNIVGMATSLALLRIEALEAGVAALKNRQEKNA